MESILPEVLEIEYSFQDQGGHNTLKLVEGRLFFFSEAHSRLSEKNEYLTMVSAPERDDWILFWKALNHAGVWDWDEDYRPEPGLTLEADIWLVKIDRGGQSVRTRSWFVEPTTRNDFFMALKHLAGVDVTLPFQYLSQTLRE